MIKKILFSVVLALLLSLTSPAFAAVKQGATTTIDVLCNLPEIQVIIPSTGEILLNPFMIPVQIGGKTVSQQIISTPTAIENKSEIPLDVSVTVTGAVRSNSDMRLLSYSTQDLDLARKYVFLYYEMHSSNSTSGIVWDSEYNEEDHIVVLDGRSISKRNMVTLDQSDKPNRYAVFRLTGDCIPNPRDEWTEADGIDVSIAFTFTPLMRSST